MNYEKYRQRSLPGFGVYDGPQIDDIYDSGQSIVSTAGKDQPKVSVRTLDDIKDDNDDRNHDYRRS